MDTGPGTISFSARLLPSATKDLCYKWSFKLGFLVYMMICVSIIAFLHFYVGRQVDNIKNSLAVQCRDPKNNRTWNPKLDHCPDRYMFDPDYLAQYDDLGQISPYLDRNISQQEVYQDTVLILTPVSNSADFLPRLFKLLCSLTYPHHLISVAIGEDSSTDDTLNYARYHANQLREHFRDIQVYHFASNFINPPYNKRHDKAFQRIRRTHLAYSRNALLFSAIKDEKWVLWVDSDVAYVPPDLIQHLLSAQQPIVVPNCLSKSFTTNTYNLYDRNTWRETPESLEYLKQRSPNFLMLEGYGTSKRRYLQDIQDEGTVVPLDGVGGCALMISANSHRQGLVFPPFLLDHHIETEGLAKMAAKMKIPIFGLPFVSVVHS